MVAGQVGKTGAHVVKTVMVEFRVGYEHVRTLDHLCQGIFVMELRFKQEFLINIRMVAGHFGKTGVHAVKLVVVEFKVDYGHAPTLDHLCWEVFVMEVRSKRKLVTNISVKNST